MTIYYEYDKDGWLIGWHRDPNRPFSTAVPPKNIPPNEARWNGEAWVRDVRLVADSKLPSYLRQLWSMTHQFIERQMDTSSRITLAMMLADPNTPFDVAQKIKDVLKWVNDVWAMYRVTKDRAQKEAVLTDLNEYQKSLKPCPHTIWDLTS